MGKTESIKQRSIYVYLPSEEMVEDWKAKAKKSSASISRFVIEHVANSLRQEEGEEAYKSRAELLQQIHEKDEQIEKITRENEIVKLALERVENELQRYRAEPFLEEDFKGIRKYDRRLIELLKQGDTIDSDHLLRLLKINPRDTPLVKAVSKQLENLEAYGLVDKTLRGWKWISR
jgi:ribosomal protein L16 Arg81 hydroxylase